MPNLFPPWRDLLLLLILHIPSILCGRKVVNYNPVEMSRGETIKYFDSVLKVKSSSLDPINEEVYFKENFAEDLYHRIDNLMPRPQFTRYLTRTKNITDKTDAHGAPQLSQYVSELNGLCSEDSVWNLTIPQILQSWDGDRSNVYNSLEEYHRKNRNTLPANLCNRFKGLMCNFAVTPSDNGLGLSVPSIQPTCQCAGDPRNIGFFRKKDRINSKHFPDGCYVRPWRPCHHLSVDTVYRQDYLDWHSSLKSSRSQLAQMVFPVGRPNRCKEGTYCMDMIPGMKMPVCWCSANSEDDRCQQNERNKDDEKRVPVGNDFQLIRKQFLHLFIHPTDFETECWPDYNVKVDKLVNSTGQDPTKTNAVQMMKEFIQLAEDEKDLKICDFRQGLYCDSVKRKCTGKTMCEEGKIHLGRGVCAVNNGDICQSTEECVEGAKCKIVKGTTDSVCLCENGYGDRCWMEGNAFFAKNFLPILIGFKGEEFLKLQVRVMSVLEAWEDQMVRDYGQGCDPQGDDVNVGIMEYFGGLGGKGGKALYDKVKGEALLVQAKGAIQEGVKLCKYNRFLRCDQRTRKCVPLVGRRIMGEGKNWGKKGGKGGGGGEGGGALEGTEYGGKIRVEVRGGEECDMKKVPELFWGMVVFECQKGFLCKQDGEMAVCQTDCGSEWAPKEECRKIRETQERENKEWEELSGRAVKEQIQKEMMEIKGEGNQVGARQLAGMSSTTDGGMMMGGMSSTTDMGMMMMTTEVMMMTTVGPVIPPMPTGMGMSTTEDGMMSMSTTMGGGGVGGGMASTTEDMGNLGGGMMSTTEDGGLGGGMMGSTTDGMGGGGGGVTFPTGGPITWGPPPATGGPPGGVVTEETTTPQQPPPPTEPPARKAVYGEPCNKDDSNPRTETFDEISGTCNRDQFITCFNTRCACAEGLVWVQRELKCMIPLGEKCDEKSLQIPDFLDRKQLSCVNGACVKDNGRDLCRPETDDLLLIVTFDQNND